jgi:putative transposase
MSRRRNVYDNAAMESCNSTFKSELGERFEDNDTEEREVVEYIEGFYNPHRRHSALRYMSPAEYEPSARLRLVV